MNTNTTVGMNISTPAAVSGPQATPYSSTNLVSPNATISVLMVFDNTRVTSRSFQVARKARTAVAARPGLIRGTTMRTMTPSGDAPSTRAESSSSRGRSAMKARSSQMVTGSLKAVWAMIRAA